jgi:hypothetical protein
MMKGYRTAIVLALVCAILIFAVPYAIQSFLANRLVVENRAGRSLEWIEITVNNRTVRFEDVATNGNVSATSEPRTTTPS